MFLAWFQYQNDIIVEVISESEKLVIMTERYLISNSFEICCSSFFTLNPPWKLILKYLVFRFHLDSKTGYVKKLIMLSPTRDHKTRDFTFKVELKNVPPQKSITWYQNCRSRNYTVKYRSSHQGGFVRKDALRNFAKFTGKHPGQSPLFK